MRKLVPIVLVLALLAIPFSTNSNYLLRLVNIALIYSLLSVSLNIVLGYAGQLALGHAALFGIGAYTAALMTAGGSGLLFWPGFVAAGLVTGLSGLLIGIPTLRLKGHYLALATLGFGEIMRHIFFNWREVTHGMDGISGIPAPSFGFFKIETDKSFFYLALAVLAIVMIATIRLERSKYGRSLAAIRDAELAAGTAGVDVSRLKIIAFVISATIAGLAGSLYAHLSSYISPDVFVFDVTAQILSMVLIGGIGTTWGPVLGAVMLTFLPELLRVSKAYYQLIYGAGIVAMVIFLPIGLMGLLRRWRPTLMLTSLRRAETPQSDALPRAPEPELPTAGRTVPPGCAAGGELLSIQRIDVSVRRPGGDRLAGLRRAARHHPRAHRAQRVRQVHVHQPGLGCLQADSRAHHFRWPVHRSIAAMEHRGSGSRAYFPESAAIQVVDRSRQRAGRLPGTRRGWLDGSILQDAACAQARNRTCADAPRKPCDSSGWSPCVANWSASSRTNSSGWSKSHGPLPCARR